MTPELWTGVIVGLAMGFVPARPWARGLFSAATIALLLFVWRNA